MKQTQKWELIINTGGDPIKSMVMLNGELISCSEVSITAMADQPSLLNIKIPIVDGNVEIKVDPSKPVYKQFITATAKEE
jgi:hypothetical protein